MTVQVTRRDVTVEMLRRQAAQTKDPAAARRMLALALVMDGSSRAEAAQACGMTRQTLRDWVHRFNAAGLAGLTNREHGGGAVARLTVSQQAEVVQWVEQGPDIERDGVARWRRVDLARRIRARFAVSLHERSVGRLLRRLGFSRISVRPRHPKADAAAQEAHKKTLPNRCARSSLRTPGASPSNSGGRMRPASVSKAV